MKILSSETSDSEAGDKKWEEGVAFSISALGDTIVYFDGAPPDFRYIKYVSAFTNGDNSRLTLVTSTHRQVDVLQLYDGLQRTKGWELFQILRSGRTRKLIGQITSPSVRSRRALNLGIFNLKYISTCKIAYSSRICVYA